MRRALLRIGVAALSLSACGAPSEPQAVVARYRDALTGDPIRSLALVTDDFHRRHGLRFADVGDLPPSVGERRSADAIGSDDEAATQEPALALERARLGWLTVLTQPAFRNFGHDLEIVNLREERNGDRSRVVARMRLREQPGIEVAFALVRGVEGEWRIDAIELRDEADVHIVLTYLLAPTADRHRRLEAWRTSR